MLQRHHAIALMLALPLLAGCDESLTDLAGATPNLTPTFSSIQRDIFLGTDSTGRLRCAQCHNPTGSGFRSTGLDLTSDAAYSLLVGVASRQRPGIMRVTPGDPDNSYLIHKIEGLSGISGVRMPQQPPYLSDGQIAIIKRWIQLGAQRN
jgi:hypothetical protein